MDYGKYIVIKRQGHKIAIMFDKLLTHSDIVNSNITEIMSAGFFIVFSKPIKEDFQDIEVEVFGKSVSLNIVSNQKDCALLKKVLRAKVEY